MLSKRLFSKSILVLSFALMGAVLSTSSFAGHYKHHCEWKNCGVIVQDGTLKGVQFKDGTIRACHYTNCNDVCHF